MILVDIPLNSFEPEPAIDSLSLLLDRRSVEMLVAFRVIQPEQRNATARIIREKISGHALRLVPFVMNGLAFLVFVRGIEVVFRPWIEEQVERNGLANLPVEEPAYDGGGVDAVGIESAEEGYSISVRGALVFIGVVILRRVVVF